MWLSVDTKVILNKLKTLKNQMKIPVDIIMRKKWSKLWRTEPIYLWGCSNITTEDIKWYIQMQAEGIIHNKKSNKLFKSYLQSIHTTDESITLKYLKFYEFCESILSDLRSLQYQVPQLLKICPENIWKEKIEHARAVDANAEKNQKLKEVLDELKNECFLNIKKIDDARAVDANAENNRQLKEVLDDLKFKCLLKIEFHRDFCEFLYELRSKVKM